MEKIVQVSFDVKDSKQIHYCCDGKSFSLPCRYTPSLHYQDDILQETGLSEDDSEVIFSHLIITEGEVILANIEVRRGAFDDVEEDINEIIGAFDEHCLNSYSFLEELPAARIETLVEWLKENLARQYFLEQIVNSKAGEIFLSHFPRYDQLPRYPILLKRWKEIYLGNYLSERKVIEELWAGDYITLPEIGGVDINNYVDWEGLADDLISQSDYEAVWSEYPDPVRLYLFDLSVLD